jgi:hypothetical protein
MVSPPVLRHIAQSSVPVTTVDPAILATALGLLAVAAIAIWLPRSPFSLGTLRHRRHRHRAAGAAATALLFLALLPSVVPYDHLFTHDAHADAAKASVHAAHCHVSPGTCSDAPITSGPGQLLMGEPLIIAPAMLAILVAATAAVLVGVSVRPEIRPPLSLAA